jgi:hypothetical protein
MPELVFEIWRDDAASEQSMAQISRQNDNVRAATMPNAALVHSFKAASDFDAFQTNYDWNRWGNWKPEPDWIERFFTDEEAMVQQAYLEERQIR